MIEVSFVEIWHCFRKIIRLPANENDCEGLLWDCDEFGVGLCKVKMV